jgi:hypothetical protein
LLLLLTPRMMSVSRRCASAGLLACCPLPIPQRGGSLEQLTSLLNLPGRDDFGLVTTWLLAALRHGGPYPLLVISGEQGSAKTVLSKMLQALVDPNTVRTLPREERDLFIAANNGHVLRPAPCLRKDSIRNRARLARSGRLMTSSMLEDDRAGSVEQHLILVGVLPPLASRQSASESHDAKADRVGPTGGYRSRRGVRKRRADCGIVNHCAIAGSSLPDDVATLKRLLLARDVELAQARAEVSSARAEASSAEALVVHLRLTIERSRSSSATCSARATGALQFLLPRTMALGWPDRRGAGASPPIGADTVRAASSNAV